MKLTITPENNLFLSQVRLGQQVKHENKVVGVVVAEKIGSKHFRIGFSAVRQDSTDVFNPILGRKMAINRAKTGTNKAVHHENTPMVQAIKEVRERAFRYFGPEVEEVIGRDKVFIAE